jgi:acetyl esterase/lipase
LRSRYLYIALACLCVLAVSVGAFPLFALNSLARVGHYREILGLRYGTGHRQQLDLYLPAPSAARPPLVVFFYGGSWRRGERADYRFVAAALTRRGFIVVVPDYRLYPEVAYPDFLSDSALAVAWALQHGAQYGADASRIFVMGHSAGAYNAAMVAFDPRWLGATGHRITELAGLIGLSGPYNFLPIRTEDTKAVFHWPTTPADSQPIAHVGAAVPRALLVTAGKDSLVDPDKNSAMLARALQGSAVAVTLRRYAQLNHYTSVAALSPALSWLAPVMDDIGAFVSDRRQAIAAAPLP